MKKQTGWQKQTGAFDINSRVPRLKFTSAEDRAAEARRQIDSDRLEAQLQAELREVWE